MKAIENDSDGFVIGATYDFPRVPMVVDVTPPRQGLEPDA